MFCLTESYYYGTKVLVSFCLLNMFADCLAQKYRNFCKQMTVDAIMQILNISIIAEPFICNIALEIDT